MMAQNNSSTCTISSQPFGTIDGQQATLWTLTNQAGMQVSIMDFGATITSLCLPNQQQQPIECVLGFNRAEDYASAEYRRNNPHLGAIIGRHAGRISYAKAPLQQQMLHLSANLQEHHLHGGHSGFDQHWWQPENIEVTEQSAALTLHLFSPDGDEGYPGNLHVWVKYTLTNQNELKVNLRAHCDQNTLLNLTQHSYFNLSASDDHISKHQLWLDAQKMIVTDHQMMPTGELGQIPCNLDFNHERPIGNNIIDTAYILPEKRADEAIVARLTAPDTGFSLAVSTDLPVMVVYNAEHLPSQRVNQRKSLQPFAAICFEPQGYTDAPNHSAFPNNILKKGDNFERNINYIFAFPDATS